MLPKDEIEKSLAVKLEGGLFEHVYLLQFGGTYFANKDFYTVKNGKVFSVNNGRLDESHDTLFTVYTECVPSGKFDPNKTFKRVNKKYSHSEIKKLLKLNK